LAVIPLLIEVDAPVKLVLLAGAGISAFGGGTVLAARDLSKPVLIES
jgi:hypothetical protein